MTAEDGSIDTAQKADLTEKRTLEGVFEAEDMTAIMMEIVS
jgi:hypothetical protein